MSSIKEAGQALASLWNYYRPPVSGDPLVDRWRMRIATALLIIVVALVGNMFFTETFPWQGPVARAAAAEELDEKLRQLLTQSTKNYKISLAQEICRLHFLRIEASGQLYDTLTKTYETKQDEYASLNARQRYNVSECAPPRAAG